MQLQKGSDFCIIEVNGKDYISPDDAKAPFKSSTGKKYDSLPTLLFTSEGTETVKVDSNDFVMDSNKSVFPAIVGARPVNIVKRK